ncbi:MAG: hypothetical protein AB1696_00260 [Planctomycetota bacterium]
MTCSSNRLFGAVLLGLLAAIHCMAADDRELDAVRKQLPADFIVERASCFVVAGDMGREQFDRFKTWTIGECSEALHRAYFNKKPNYTITIYLFNGDKSYRSWAKKLFNEEPSSPYGYYTPSERRMVMNIATGGGTLVHEMVHALMRPDFPGAPTWFDEGLGSLYEQCTTGEDGLLKGLINWRYEGLMEAVRKNRLVPLKDVVRMSDDQFRGRGSGLHYAEARYFCMYLQEKKLLRTFYKTFRDRYNEDKTGETFLVELLGKDLDAVEAVWIAWVKGLESR